MKKSCLYTTYACALVILCAGVADGQEAVSGVERTPPPPTLALSPAVAMLRAKPGQSVTQTITIANGLPAELSFTIEVQDVVVRDGKRGFLPAGQVASSIAAAAIASPSLVVAPPGKRVSVNITLTIPPDTRQRAVVAFFKGQLVAPGQGSVGFSASLGTLITLNLSDDAKIVRDRLPRARRATAPTWACPRSWKTPAPSQWCRGGSSPFWMTAAGGLPRLISSHTGCYRENGGRSPSSVPPHSGPGVTGLWRPLSMRGRS